MESNRKSKYKSKIDKEDEDDEDLGVANEKQSSYNKSTKLQLRISARVVVTGPISGKRYVWERSGAIVEVRKSDVAGLLEKQLGDKGCCGGDLDNLKLFALVE